MNEYDDPSPFFSGLDFSHPTFVLNEDVAREVVAALKSPSSEALQQKTQQLACATTLKVDANILHALPAKDLKIVYEFLKRNVYAFIVIENCEGVTNYDNAYKLLQSLMLIRGPLSAKYTVLCVHTSNVLFNKVLTNVDVTLERLILVKPLMPVNLKDVKVRHLCVVPRVKGTVPVEAVHVASLQELYVYSTDFGHKDYVPVPWKPPRWYPLLANLKVLCLHPNATGTLSYSVETLFFRGNNIQFLDLYWGQLGCDPRRPQPSTVRLTGLRHNGAGHVPSGVKQLWVQSHKIPRRFNRVETQRVMPRLTSLGVAKIHVANSLMKPTRDLKRFQYVAYGDVHGGELQLPSQVTELKWHAPASTAAKLVGGIAHLTRVDLYCPFDDALTILDGHASTLRHVKIGISVDALSPKRLWKVLCKITNLQTLVVLRYPMTELGALSDFMKSCTLPLTKFCVYFVSLGSTTLSDVLEFRASRKLLVNLKWFETNAFVVADPYNGVCAYPEQNVVGCPKRLEDMKHFVYSKYPPIKQN